MVEEDGLTDDQLPTFRKYGGGAIVRNLYETTEERKARGDAALPPMNLVERRNPAAHGDPFDNMPCAGLIEVVRDLIEYAYRHFIAERRRAGGDDWILRAPCNSPAAAPSRGSRLREVWPIMSKKRV